MPAHIILPLIATAVVGVVLISVWLDLKSKKNTSNNTDEDGRDNLIDDEQYRDSFTHKIMKNPFIYPCCENINDISIIVKKNSELNGICPHCNEKFDIKKTRPDLLLANKIKKKFK